MADWDALVRQLDAVAVELEDGIVSPRLEALPRLLRAAGFKSPYSMVAEHVEAFLAKAPEPPAADIDFLARLIRLKAATIQRTLMESSRSS